MSTTSAAQGRGPTAPEPIAIIGMGCRFPGDAGSPDSFWKLLNEETVTVAEVPGDRWDYYRNLGAPFESAVRRAIKNGNFLSRIEEFDAEFFGISPREAALMDPQQRLLLEVAWEALEHAGLPAATLAGTDTGVFVGLCTGDYGGRILEDLPSIEAWTGIGAATCAVANRLSHVLDLRGPSIAVDTACSASLVATHLACQSLRLGESDVAFAGGVNLIVSPGQTLTLDTSGALAPDGRSKPFDATADGYGRGEGCGVLVLKRLSDAQRDGDRVLAVVRSSAVNQDGHTNGIMAPSGEAQEHVMNKACEFAGIDPATVDYVEAHGTGTRLGDPLEAAALSASYGTVRDTGDPCLIGSVKANIGHLEGAAGVASIIKTVLALGAASIPATPLSTGLNPEIPWKESGLRVVTETEPWPSRGPVRRAGVSGFGYGGTVAHVLLEQAPDTDPDATGTADISHGEGGLRLFPLSARTQPALREQAASLADSITGRAPATLDDVQHTLARRRAHLDTRAVVVAEDLKGLENGLRRLAEGVRDEHVVTATATDHGGSGLVWVFSGHGSQWRGMGRELLTKPPFARVMDELGPIFAEEIGFTPREVLLTDDLESVDRIQTMIFAMQVGLAEVWRAHGVVPSAVIGHSVGEIAAAVVTGALSLSDGARLICRRSALLRRAAGQGAMAMATVSFDEALRRLGDRTDVVPAIMASPVSTVISGDLAALEEVRRSWSADGVGLRRVDSDVAFHSPHMDPLLPDLMSATDDLTPTAPRIRMYSTALTDPRAVPAADGEYWAGNLRNPVRLATAVTAALDDGYRAFLEISPHPVVTHSILEIVEQHGADEVFVGSTLRRDRSEELSFLAALASLHANGVELDWDLLAPSGGLTGLPTVAWQHRRHWHSAAAPRGAGRGHDPESATLLGTPLSAAGSPLRMWMTSLDDTNRPYPGSHTLNGTEIVPAAVIVETFRRAPGLDPAPALTGIVIQHPLFTADPHDVQVVVDGDVARLASRSPLAGGESTDQEPPWLIHAHAVLRDPAEAGSLPAPMDEDSLDRLPPVDPGLVRSRLAAVGVPATGFDWTVDEFLYGDGRLRARVRLGSDQAGATWAAAQDAVMSIAPAAFSGDPVLRMVVRIDEVVTVGDVPGYVFVEVVLDEDRPDVADALVLDLDGTVIGVLGGLHYPAIDELLGGAGQLDAGDSARSSEWSSSRIAELSAPELLVRVETEVRSQIAGEMGLAPEGLHLRKTLLEQGFDSVMTVTVRRRFQSIFDIDLPATVFWQQPSAAAIAGHITELLAGRTGAGA